MKLRERWILFWRRFSPLEERLLAAVRDVLPAAAFPIYDAQVAAINHVQRMPGWTEIDFYRRRRGKVDWNGVPMYPRTGEFPLADVSFSAKGRRYKATLTCIAGHVFDFALTPAPRDAGFADWDAPATARLLSDPFAAGAPRPPEPIPAAWREFMARNRPQETAGWTLHDDRSAYRVTIGDVGFVVLAERAGGEFVLQPIGQPASPMFYLEAHDATPEPIHGEIADLFRRSTTENR